MPLPSYFAAGANRQTAAADWAADGTLVYGAGVNLAVWRPSHEAGVGSLLSGHADTVKAVQAVAESVADSAAESVSHKTTYFVSGGDDKALKLWAISHDSATSKTSGRCIQTVDDAHGAPVNYIAAERLRHATDLPTPASKSTRRLFATGGADYAIKIWALDQPDTEPEPRISLLQTITTKPKYFPLCLALVSLTSSNGAPSAWLLAAAGTSNRIQIFAGSETPSSPSSPSKDVTFSLEATLSGHEGWVRSLDFAWEHSSDPDSDILLASASQDKYVRLWRVHRGSSMPAPSASAAAAASLLGEEGLLPTLSASSPSSPSNKAHRLRVASEDYSVTFEALLFGHEDWIYSAKWDVSSPNPSSTSGTNRSTRLLTTSADNSLAVWEADASSGIWVTTARLGELSKEKGATTATGSVGGFWVGLWGVNSMDRCSSEVVVLCRTGSWRRWVWATSRDAPEGRWVQAVGVSGHVKPVTGIAWSRDGSYLLSTSSDQTTRLHAEWSGPSSKSSPSNSWHEMARPQIHGYDLNCIDALGPTQFVSGADEKLMRVFHEPKSVARLLADLGVTGARSLSDLDVLPDAANMPVLGLSNKAVDDDGGEAPQPVEISQTPETCEGAETSEATTARPPYEDTLARSTLWPETEKLYGHGYEISCLAVSHDGSLVASACRASSLNHAVVRLFETDKWTEVRPPLATHSLTVTRLRFSADDTFLLSVGRDRQWAIFQRRDGGSSPNEYSVYENNSKAHSRMILDCAWAPSVEADGHENKKMRVFATAGRDKNVKVWATTATTSTAEGGMEGKDKFVLATTIAQDHPVTAVDFLWRTSTATAGAAPLFILGIGTEAGRLSVVSLDAKTLAVSSVLVVDAGLCLPQAVLQLAWRPRHVKAAEAEGTTSDETAVDLAVAGDDSSLRVYKVDL
ncbi:rna polymerase ii elongator subunit [Ophiostoma piceae UAMH 11346]|uniref:Elongator complex protein 2 n=1 Tax=Ophiostoma piceae (strain UAMH 11346) TaxID=1262450 RepID=S3CD85_OPHP1|nr:rna polymerase ii elongator subunit [Ophiostoma piceae UAMH 11346]